jgi:ankyrin repeat protein
MADDRSHGARPLAQSPEDLRILHQLCRDGRLYDVERWIAGGKPLQVTPESIRKGTRPKTALQIALESGQHSLASLLLRSGYRLELEGYAPLDLTLRARRWDLFDLLLEWGADLKTVDADTVLDTYNVELSLGGQNGEEGREGGRAENGRSVNWAFIASTLTDS